MQYLLRIIVVLGLSLGFLSVPAYSAESWEGVDKTVVEKFASEAGRPPSKPYINTDQGDLLLFLFLLSGTAGGFVAGYAFRTLFPPKVAAETPHASRCGVASETSSQS